MSIASPEATSTEGCSNNHVARRREHTEGKNNGSTTDTILGPAARREYL
jgi:hypothetical protein